MQTFISVLQIVASLGLIVVRVRTTSPIPAQGGLKQCQNEAVSQENKKGNYLV